MLLLLASGDDGGGGYIPIPVDDQMRLLSFRQSSQLQLLTFRRKQLRVTKCHYNQ